MMPWIGITAISLGVLALLIYPSIRKSAANSKNENQNFFIAVYKDQLSELDQDLEHGLVSKKEEKKIRLEIQRRLLLASNTSYHVSATKNGKIGLVIPIISFTAIICTFLLYLQLGTPSMPDAPATARLNLSDSLIIKPPFLSIDDVINQLEIDKDKNQNNPKFWMKLGHNYQKIGRYQEAQDAFLHLYEITGSLRAQMKYAEALILNNNSRISPTALRIFNRILRANPFNSKAQFYIGMAAAQEGSFRKAIQIWVDLLYLSGPDAPWASTVQSQAHKTAEKANVDLSTIKPSNTAIKLLEGLRRVH